MVVHLGMVSRFDAARGLGEIHAGEADYAFQCTAISDGTRQIDEGAAVAFVLLPRPGGALEAGEVTKLSPPSGLPGQPGA